MYRLLEDPEAEISVAKILAERYINRHYDGHIEDDILESPVNSFECHKRNTYEVLNIGKDNRPVIIISSENAIEKTAVDYVYNKDRKVSYASIVNAADGTR